MESDYNRTLGNFNNDNIIDEKDTIYQRKKEANEKKKKNPEEFNICAEKKYFIKRQNEGNINIIQVL